jgi:hypothetical protein
MANAFEVLRGGTGSAGDPYHVFAGFPYAPNICVFCELPRGNHVAVNMSHSEANARDAARYRRLRVLGARVYAAPYSVGSLSDLLCFTNLDEVVDADIAAHPSRGEAKEG